MPEALHAALDAVAWLLPNGSCVGPVPVSAAETAGARMNRLAAVVEQAAAASESMKDQAGNLSQAVAEFKLAEPADGAAWAGGEHRGPNRAVNVSRLAPVRPSDKPGPAPATRQSGRPATKPVAPATRKKKAHRSPVRGRRAGARS